MESIALGVGLSVGSLMVQEGIRRSRSSSKNSSRGSSRFASPSPNLENIYEADASDENEDAHVDEKKRLSIKKITKSSVRENPLMGFLKKFHRKKVADRIVEQVKQEAEQKVIEEFKQITKNEPSKKTRVHLLVEKKELEQQLKDFIPDVKKLTRVEKLMELKKMRDEIDERLNLAIIKLQEHKKMIDELED
jgi:hypothetical protein